MIITNLLLNSFFRSKRFLFVIPAQPRKTLIAFLLVLTYLQMRIFMESLITAEDFQFSDFNFISGFVYKFSLSVKN